MTTAIIILNKSNNELLFRCLNSIKDKSSYKDYNIYVGDTGSTSEEIEGIKQYLSTNFTGKSKLLILPSYHFAKNNNDIVKKYLQGEEVLVFCNNDIELIDDCLSVFAQEIVKENIGTLGCKLLFEDRTIQHAGQYIKANGIIYEDKMYGNFKIGHLEHGKEESCMTSNYYVAGNTGGFLCVRREVYDKVGGFDESFKECLEDVKFNLSVMLLGYANYCLYGYKAFHLTSKTRDLDIEKKNKGYIEDYKKCLVPFLVNNMKELINRKGIINNLTLPEFILSTKQIEKKEIKDGSMLFAYPIFCPNENLFKKNKESLISILEFFIENNIKLEMSIGGYALDEYWEEIMNIINTKISGKFACSMFRFDKNFGKAFVVNTLVEKYNKEFQFLLTCDSDIIFLKEENKFIDKLKNVMLNYEKEQGVKCGVVGTAYKNGGVHNFDKMDKTGNINGDIVCWESKNTAVVAGGCILIDYKLWKEIKGYEVKGIFGEIDASLMVKSGLSNYMNCVCMDAIVHHPEDNDSGYRDYKNSIIKKMFSSTHEELVEDDRKFWERFKEEEKELRLERKHKRGYVGVVGLELLINTIEGKDLLMAEIGCLAGGSTELFLNSNKFNKI